MDEDPVFVLQRDDVRHRPERDQIQSLAQVEIRERTGFEQSVGQLEDKANTAKISEGGVGDRFGIDDGNALRKFPFRFVMVEHDHIRAARANASDFSARRSPAIDCDQEFGLDAIASSARLPRD